MRAHVDVEVGLLEETLFTSRQGAFVLLPGLLIRGSKSIATVCHDTVVSGHEAIVCSVAKLLQRRELMRIRVVDLGL